MHDNFCQLCTAKLRHTFVDLGMSPLCETFIKPQHLDAAEAFYPLHTFVCDACFLVQVPEHVAPANIYSDYPYFSSYSDSWLAHAKTYCDEVSQRFNLTTSSMVVEVASNDGYLLRNFVEKGIPCFGVEPAINVADAAREAGIDTVSVFMGRHAAKELVAVKGKADLLIGNNVLAHVPNLHDFISGLKIMLKDTGVITMEFPHLQQLMQENQFDTIYHEHFSYLSFYVVEKEFARHGLTLFDVEQLPTHGGSLRIFAKHSSNPHLPITHAVHALKQQELAFGINKLSTYQVFAQKVVETKYKLLEFLIAAKRDGKSVVGYGAPGKANTLLNYCGIRSDLLEYTVDRSPHKQGKFTPGTRIPIYHPERIFKTKPDYVLILPWNLAGEIRQQMCDIEQWGGQFVVPIPEIKIG